jgi:type I restriction enzyme S subunit
MIADLRPYPEYKESGLPWLGQVPRHWKESRVKNLAKPGYKTFVDGDWIESPFIREAGIRLIQTGNIGLGAYREKGFRYIDEETFQAFGCTDFQAGDVLICRLGDPVGRACLAPNLGVRMITSVDVCILKTRQDVAPAFVVYVMSAPQYLHWVGSLVRGSTRDRVSRSMLGGFMIRLPPPSEQAAIVRFLDWANGRLERAIRAKRKVIALLHEQKQAIIHRAVTRGLDPNVRLKPSGVEWLGEVPEHWDSAAVRRYCRVFAGATPRRAVPDYWANGSIPWLSSGEVNLRRITKAEQFITEAGYAASSTKWIRPRSLVLALAGQGRTKGMVATVECWTTCNQSLAVIEPSPGRADHRFLAYYLESRYLDLRALVGDGLRDGLNLEHVRSIPTPLPPLKEQSAIVRFLDHADRRTDAAIAQNAREISLLREFRTRLIADVVTGKLDVREAAAHLPEETDEPEPLDDTDTSPEDIGEETEATDPDAALEEAEA